MQKALDINKPLALATAYFMKEELRQSWNQPGKASAEVFLIHWMGRARAWKLHAQTLCNTLAAHKSELLAYYDHPISTGSLEGPNNEIKTMQKQTYGFRDMDFFKLKIMAVHQAKYALVG